MNMQKLILGRKNHITIVSAILIIIAYVSKLGFQNEPIAIWSLIIASVLGVIPIAIQAYQALRVKVVSIDVLVTIAVIGAFLIRIMRSQQLLPFYFYLELI